MPVPSRPLGRWLRALTTSRSTEKASLVRSRARWKKLPALLEHQGACVNTSVRTDVLKRTIDRRRAVGHVWVWDPFGTETDSWDPLQGCDDWEHALLVARWLGHAMRLGASHSQEYFDQEAEGLTAPLLHAAALDHGRSILDVYRWTLARENDEPERILDQAGAGDAIERLVNVYSYTERQRDGIIGTAAVQLKVYGHPAAARTAQRHQGVTPEALFANGEANSLYIVAGREHQQLLAPLVVTLLSSLLHQLAQAENKDGHGLWPPAVFALDETANIAPLEDLPQILATSLPSARFLTVWHSVAQMHRHYGDAAAEELLALSQAKLFLGSITDRRTVQELTRLLGHRASENGQNPEILTAQALQRMSSGEGLLIHTDQPPAFYRQRRYYNDPTAAIVLRELVGVLPALLNEDAIRELADRLRPHLAGPTVSVPEPLLTTREAAEYARVSVETIRRALRAGDMPVAAMIGRSRRLTRGAVDGWLAETRPVQAAPRTTQPRRRRRDPGATAGSLRAYWREP
jgi:type IV secretion system protein VirD4